MSTTATAPLSQSSEQPRSIVAQLHRYNIPPFRRTHPQSDSVDASTTPAIITASSNEPGDVSNSASAAVNYHFSVPASEIRDGGFCLIFEPLNTQPSPSPLSTPPSSPLLPPISFPPEPSSLPSFLPFVPMAPSASRTKPSSKAQKVISGSSRRDPKGQVTGSREARIQGKYSIVFLHSEDR